MWQKVVIGDSRRMGEVADTSVHLVVTSPPYWQLKDYGDERQIGFHDSYEAYVNNLNLVWKECHRVLHNGCRLCINVGDQFARSAYYGRYKVIPIRTEIIKFCESSGFDYMGSIIWRKVTTCHTTGGATVMGSFPYPRNGILKLDYEFILIFKKYGRPPGVSLDVKEQSKLTKEEWNEYFSGHWHFPGTRQRKHLAMFPEELPRRLIKMFSFVGDTILDPFLGSGTTSLAAKRLKRHAIGYEINEDFLPTIQETLGGAQKNLFDETEIKVRKQRDTSLDFEKEIRTLPYIFEDPVAFDKRVDPRNLSFGSKVDKLDADAVEQYYTVKKIVSPERLILGNGLRIRLLGVKEIPARSMAAMAFLKNKTRGQRVFLRFDDIQYDDDQNLFCYLYLSNKTFVNAHLIKQGLADVDHAREYKRKSRFMGYRKKMASEHRSEENG